MREEQPNPCSGWVLCKGVRGVGGCTHAKVHPRAVSRASCSSAPAQRVPSLLGYTFPAALGSCCQEPPPKLCFPPTQLTSLAVARQMVSPCLSPWRWDLQLCVHCWGCEGTIPHAGPWDDLS